MNNIKTYLMALPLLLGFLLTAPVQAAAINWTLSGVTFDDGGTASGTFSTDATTGSLLSWDITTTAGNFPFGGYHYDSSSSFRDVSTPISFSVLSVNTNFSPVLDLHFVNPLNVVGVSPFANGSREYHILIVQNDSELHQRAITAGYATSITAVPDPETYAMMLAGLGLLGFAARRRKQAQAA